MSITLSFSAQRTTEVRIATSGPHLSVPDVMTRFRFFPSPVMV